MPRRVEGQPVSKSSRVECGYLPRQKRAETAHRAADHKVRVPAWLASNVDLAFGSEQDKVACLKLEEWLDSGGSFGSGVDWKDPADPEAMREAAALSESIIFEYYRSAPREILTRFAGKAIRTKVR